MGDDKKRNADERAGGAAKKHKSAYAKAQPKHPSEKAIPAGAVGLFLTCEAGRERRAADEIVAMLEDTYTRLGAQDAGAHSAEPSSTKGASVDALLAAEVAQLRDKSKDRFKRHDTGVRGTAFVELPVGDGCPTAETVSEDLARHVRDTRSLPGRYVMRVLPVQHVCFVALDEIRAIAQKAAAQHFPEAGPAVTFAVDFEHRSCDKLKRGEVVDVVAKAVPAPPHRVDLKAPEKTLVVQLVRNVCALGVVSEFRRLARMNLRKLAEDEGEETANGSGPQSACTAKAEVTLV